jgi:hypothetical protein
MFSDFFLPFPTSCVDHNVLLALFSFFLASQRWNCSSTPRVTPLGLLPVRTRTTLSGERSRRPTEATWLDRFQLQHISERGGEPCSGGIGIFCLFFSDDSANRGEPAEGFWLWKFERAPTNNLRLRSLPLTSPLGPLFERRSALTFGVAFSRYGFIAMSWKLLPQLLISAALHALPCDRDPNSIRIHRCVSC